MLGDDIWLKSVGLYVLCDFYSRWHLPFLLHLVAVHTSARCREHTALAQRISVHMLTGSRIHGSAEDRIVEEVRRIFEEREYINRKKKPKADPLVATHETIMGLHRQIQLAIPSGLTAFISKMVPKRDDEVLIMQGEQMHYQDADGRRRDVFDMFDAVTGNQLIVLSDSASSMFASYLHMVNTGLRCLWHPGPCHQESNCNINTCNYSCGKDHVPKLEFLSKMSQGPFKTSSGGGKWRKENQETLQLILDGIQTPGSSLHDIFQGFHLPLRRLCMMLQL